VWSTRVKKLAFVLSTLAIGTVTASAADLAPRYTKAPPAPIAVFSWTGCYIGGDVGGGSQRQSASVSRQSLRKPTGAPPKGWASDFCSRFSAFTCLSP